MQLIRVLEEQLLQPEVRTSSERLAALLADEFIEIGSSGRVYNKQQIIDLLCHEGGQGSPPTLRDFSARRLAAEVILVTYNIIESQTIRSIGLEIDRWTLANGISSGHKIWRFQRTHEVATSWPGMRAALHRAFERNLALVRR
jgi:hypothetical protein